MSGVHLSEAEKGALVFPVVGRGLFVPMASHPKVGILISCLPCITSERDEPRLSILQSDQHQDSAESKVKQFSDAH